MEKFSQFRDKGSGISPFIPIKTPSTILTSTPRILLFLFRLPLFLPYITLYFLLLHHLPLPPAARKLLLWVILGIPGIWWVDLQLDGVKRGKLSAQPPSRFPHPGSIIAANFTSPVDAVYLAAIFDPVFTVSYPGTRKVQRISLLRAALLALAPPPASRPPREGSLTTLAALRKAHPDRVIVVFPECTTTNGKAILPFSPSLAGAPAEAPIFPLSMRYSPPDITTPVPGAWGFFLWKLLSRPTHTVRVRIAEAMGPGGKGEGQAVGGVVASGEGGDGEDPITGDEQKLLDKVADALARLGRNARVGLTVRDKAEFVKAWKVRRK